MTARPINEAEVRRAIEALGFDWLYAGQTGSTNADALEHHANHGRDLVAFCEEQTAGRGRRGRQWASPFARNIYCTIGISRSIPASRQGLLSIVTGVALCRALRDCTGAQVNLKWPNDLLLDHRKCGGILIESRALEDERFFFAVGFGLNLLMDAEELAALDRPATSLAHHIEAEPDRSEVLVASVEAVVTAIRAFEVESVPELIDAFADLDQYHGETVEVVAAQGTTSGINRGIDARGQLCLETERGIELHSAAEISLRRASA